MPRCYVRNERHYREVLAAREQARLLAEAASRMEDLSKGNEYGPSLFSKEKKTRKKSEK